MKSRNPNYQSIEEARNRVGRHPPDESRNVYENGYALPPFGSQKHHVTTAVQDSSRAPAPSAASPFFRHGATELRPSPLKRVPLKKNHNQPHHGTPSVSRSLNGLSFIEKPHRPVDHRPLFHSPMHYSGAANEYEQQRLGVPQTPRNAQGLFQRQDRTQLLASHTALRPQSKMLNNGVGRRVYDAPRSSNAVRQNQNLSQIPGVRDVSSQRGSTAQQRIQPSYGAQRTFFSTAGGRRSVRR